jgi:hypothetical protein
VLVLLIDYKASNAYVNGQIIVGSKKGTPEAKCNIVIALHPGANISYAENMVFITVGRATDYSYSL